MSKKASAFPKARRFAVVRMDPVAMVEHLQDPLATNAARAMRPKKYLVYLEFPQDLPMPDSSYCRYRVNAVAARLRPPVPEKGITRDMVVPIYPNTHRARDDVKIASTPVFPFSNCYFWIDARMSLRVRVSRNREYENDSAYQLDISQHVALSDAFEHDFARINQFWRERPTAYVEGLEAHMDGVFSTALSSLDTDEFAFEDDHMSSDSSLEPDPLLNATPPIPPSITDILSMNVFGWDDDPSFQFIPLVDLWLDLKEHLSEDSIPNPVGLWKEQEWVGV
ncbi:hypothetical protein L226DRAFT_470235 [Lentinus tigrinus ALCF2SS1-7]|uniref:uncharacterized protein n=1 Tax=Lentinus tigrinus ALCF2SS1-7 TaxID=1328758 RepID=UPI001165CB03|nr:hypothetical protein L226DRAFT_470235 [Lentinus tigrinus ALCF2SS1-7]